MGVTSEPFAREFTYKVNSEDKNDCVNSVFSLRKKDRK